MTQIPINTNLYLWLLTGRTDDYANPTLNNGISYSIKRTPADVVAARELLKLDDTRTDFYVLGALAAAMTSTSLMRSMVGNNDAVFRGGLLTIPSIPPSEDLLTPDGHSWATISGAPGGKAGFTHLEFTYGDSGSIEITTDSGIQDTSKFSLTDREGGGKRLSIDKAAQYGVMADFAVSDWGYVSDPITVPISPSRYPHADFVTKLRRHTPSINLMTTHGTMQAFASTSNPVRQLGMLSLAIIRAMAKQINEEQAGFSVETGLDEDLQRTYSIASTVLDSGDDDACANPPVGFDV